MNRDELSEKAVEFFEHYKVASTSPKFSVEGLMADFALGMYEAGQRAERERVQLLLKAIDAFELALDELDFAGYHTGEEIDHFRKAHANLYRICRELRAEPAESGE